MALSDQRCDLRVARLRLPSWELLATRNCSSGYRPRVGHGRRHRLRRSSMMARRDD